MDKIILLEKKFFELEKRVTKLENKTIKSTQSIEKITGIEEKLSENIEKIGFQNLVILALRISDKQTKKQLKSTIISWGAKKTIDVWFKGGNFNNRLLGKGIVMKDGKNEEDDLYSLTKIKGVKLAASLIEKYFTTS